MSTTQETREAGDVTIRRHTQKPSTYTYRLTNPFYPHGPKQFWIRGESEEHLRRKVARYKDFLEEVRLGMRDRAEVIQRIVEASSSPVTLAQAWERHRDTIPGADPKKWASTWVHQVEPFLGADCLSSLTRARIGQWVEWLKSEGYAPNTARVALDFLRMLVQREIDAGSISEIPWRGFKLRKWAPPRTVEKAHSMAEIVMILDAAWERDRKNSRLRTPDLFVRVLVTFLCALRKGEASALGWDDVDLDRSPSWVHVRYTAHDGWRFLYPGQHRSPSPTKTRTEKHLVLHPSCDLALRWQRAMLSGRGWYRADGPVFPDKWGQFRPNGDVIRWEEWRALVKSSGVPRPERWVIHSLRHSAALMEVLAGASIEEVRSRTGHGSVDQVAHYFASARPLASRIGEAPGQGEPTKAFDFAGYVKERLEGLSLILRELPTDQHKALSRPSRPLESLSLEELGRLSWDPIRKRECFAEARRRARVSYLAAYRQAEPVMRNTLAPRAYRQEMAKFKRSRTKGKGARYECDKPRDEPRDATHDEPRG